MKRFTLTATAVLLLAAPAFAGGWIQSLATAQKKAQQSKQLIFVDLFADWCGWCHKMEQEVFPSAAFQKETDDMVLLRLNTEDGAEGTKLAQRYSITSLPTFLILTPDLNVAGVIHGYLPSKEFVDAVDDAEKKFRQFEKLAAAEPSFPKDFAKRLDLARGFNERFQYAQGESRFRKLVQEGGVPADVRDKAYYELAITQVVQGHMDDANKTLAAFSKVASKGDPFEKSRLLQAQVYMQQGNSAAALVELRGFKAKFPTSPYAATVDYHIKQLERAQASK